MKLDRYQLKSEQEFTIFEFVSRGPKGEFVKLIEFTTTNLKDFYNLAFGDKDGVTGSINDSVVTNNHDTEKILATVAEAVLLSTHKHPEAWVYATGSTVARTRLYRMGINKYFDDVAAEFYIFGELEDSWLPFEPGIDFIGYVVKRKH